MRVCGQKWAWYSNFNEWMNLDEFLHVNTYLRKLKVTLIVIGWAWSNMDVSFQVMGLYNLLYLINEWMNWADFFCILIHGARKAKSYFGYAHGQIWLWPFMFWDSINQSIHPSIHQSINQSINQLEFIHDKKYIYI